MRRSYYPVTSTIGKRDPEVMAWSDGNIESSDEETYKGDAPTGYTDPVFSELLQRLRRYGYPVTSTIGARDPEVMAWSDGNIASSDEDTYKGDAPTGYTEPVFSDLLHRSRRSRYPVTSTIGKRDPEVMAWSDGNVESSDEETYKGDAPTGYTDPVFSDLMQHLRHRKYQRRNHPIHHHLNGE